MVTMNDIIKEMHDMVGILGFADSNSSVTGSGRYLNEGHPLVTKANIETIAPESYPTPSATYSAVTTYAAGAKVNWCGMEFESKVGSNLGNHPLRYPDKWQALGIVTNVDGYAYTMKLNAIKGLLGDLVTSKKLNGTAKTVFGNMYLIYGTGRIKNKVENKGRLVGLEITITRSKGVISNIRRIGLQMDTAQTVTVYLFHSSSIDPITSYDVICADNKFSYLDVTDAILKYEDGENVGGSYYLVYYQDDITGNAITIDGDIRGGCSACDRQQQQAYNKYSPFMKVQPFYVPSVNLDADDMPSGQSFADLKALWDIQHNVYMDSGNFGFNISFDIGCDITKLLVEHKSMFTSAIIKKFAYETLRQFLFNPNTRVNRAVEKYDRATLIFELEGDPEKPSGLKHELQREIEALEFDTSGLDSTCLPCIRKGVRYGSV